MYPSIKDLLRAMESAVAAALSSNTCLSRAVFEDLQLGFRAIAEIQNNGVSENSSDGGSIDAERKGLSRLGPSAELDPDELPRPGDGFFQDYLRKRLDCKSLKLTDVDKISGGFSRETIALTYFDGAQSRQIILRKELQGGLLENIGATLGEEFPILLLARSGGVPVARPLWLETDETLIGGTFIAMERAKGSSLGTSLGAEGAIGQRDLHQLAIILAKLHVINWRDTEYDVPSYMSFGERPVDATRAATELLDRWEYYWRSLPLATSPILDAAIAWMRSNIAINRALPCLTHGDIGFHNIMGDKDGFTSLLDWELSSIASPAKDLAHVLPSIAHLVNWPEFLGWYHDAGGPEISQDEIRWFEVFRAFSMILVCKAALAKICDPNLARLEYLRLGLVAQPVFFDQLRSLLP